MRVWVQLSLLLTALFLQGCDEEGAPEAGADFSARSASETTTAESTNKVVAAPTAKGVDVKAAKPSTAAATKKKANFKPPVEKRYAQDGKLTTEAEFAKKFGVQFGAVLWSNAESDITNIQDSKSEALKPPPIATGINAPPPPRFDQDGKLLPPSKNSIPLPPPPPPPKLPFGGSANPAWRPSMAALLKGRSALKKTNKSGVNKRDAIDAANAKLKDGYANTTQFGKDGDLDGDTETKDGDGDSVAETSSDGIDDVEKLPEPKLGESDDDADDDAKLPEPKPKVLQRSQSSPSLLEEETEMEEDGPATFIQVDASGVSGDRGSREVRRHAAARDQNDESTTNDESQIARINS